MKSSTFVISGFLLFYAAGPAPAQDSPLQTDIAQRQAELWLAQVDGGAYDLSWQEAATSFQQDVPKERWKTGVSSLRAPLGRLLSRKLAWRQYTEVLPGEREGSYVLLSYKSRFEGGRLAVETVTANFDGTRGWRVSGYRLQARPRE